MSRPEKPFETRFGRTMGKAYDDMHFIRQDVLDKVVADIEKSELIGLMTSDQIHMMVDNTVGRYAIRKRQLFKILANNPNIADLACTKLLSEEAAKAIFCPAKQKLKDGVKIEVNISMSIFALAQKTLAQELAIHQLLNRVLPTNPINGRSSKKSSRPIRD